MKGRRGLLALLLLSTGAIAGTTLLIKQRYFLVIASSTEPFWADVARISTEDFDVSDVNIVVLNKTMQTVDLSPNTLILSGSYIYNGYSQNLPVNVSLKISNYGKNFVIAGIAYSDKDGCTNNLASLLELSYAKKGDEELCVSAYRYCKNDEPCIIYKTYEIFSGNSFSPIYFVYVPALYDNDTVINVEASINLAK